MKIFLKENWLKIIIIVFLLGALGDRTNLYYHHTRLLVTICSARWAYRYFRMGRFDWMSLFIILTVLFNFLSPFHFMRETWQILDLLGIVLFSISLFIKNLPETHEMSKKTMSILATISWTVFIILWGLTSYVNHYMPHGPIIDTGYEHDTGAKVYMEDVRRLDIPEWAKFLRIDYKADILFWGLLLMGAMTSTLSSKKEETW